MVWQKYILNKESLEYLYETLIPAEWSLNKREGGSYNQFSSYIEDAKRVKYFYPNIYLHNSLLPCLFRI